MAEELERGENGAKLVKTLDPLGHGLEELGGHMVEYRQLIRHGGVELEVGLILEGGDVHLLAPAHIGPHAHGLRRRGAPEVVVPDGAAHQTEPCAFEHDLSLKLHIAAGGDIELEGLRVLVRDHVVQGVDALENDHLIAAQLDGLGGLLHPHPAGELIFGNKDALALGQHGEVPVQKLHVHAVRGLQIQISLRGAGGGGRVDGLEIIVHGHIVGADAPLFQGFGDFHGRGGLA